MQLAELLEAMMIVSFGISWPFLSQPLNEGQERPVQLLYPVWLHLRHFVQAHDAQP